MILFFLCSLLFADKVKGPDYYHDVGADHRKNNHDENTPKIIRRNKFRMNAPIPLGEQFFLFNFQYQTERYTTSVPNSPEVKFEAPMYGFSYFPNYKLGDLPQWAFTLNEYGGFYSDPMYEMILSYNLDQTPFAVKLGESGYTYLLLYVRKYPFGYKTLPIFSTHVKFSGGYFLTVAIPTTFYVGWKSADEKTIVEFDAYGQAIQYPWPDIEQGGWVDGYSINLVLGVKQNIFSAFYGATYAGFQKADYFYHTKRQQNYRTVHTQYIPVVMLGVETYFDAK